MDIITSSDPKRHMLMCFFLWILFFCMVIESDAQLSENFYASTCPNVELIVRQAVTTKYQQTTITAPATLRMFFHDCFVGVCSLVVISKLFLRSFFCLYCCVMWLVIVQGCDASVLIASNNGDAERDAQDNISLAGDGFDTVNKAKLAVEAQCPGLVSCTDIMALAARDVVVLVSQHRSLTLHLISKISKKNPCFILNVVLAFEILFYNKYSFIFSVQK